MPTDSISRPLRPFRTSRLAAAIIVALASAACGGDGGTDPTPSPDPVQVSVSSSAQTVGAAGSATFTATVSNASNPAVTWAASGGDVSGAGASVTWTAPVAGGSYSVTATSVEDPTKSASASVTVTSVTVSVEPASVTVFREQPTTFTAAVSGTTASTDVDWSVDCGSLDGSGTSVTWTAPSEAGACTVTATSALDGDASAGASATVRAATLVTTEADTDDGACTWDHCSLREALAAANADPAPDTIYLSQAAADPTAPAAMRGPMPFRSVAVESALPPITTSVTLVGEGSSVSEIDVGGSTADPRRGLDVDGAGIVVTVEGFTLRNTASDEGSAVRVRGGAELRSHHLAVVATEPVTAGGPAIFGSGPTTLVVLGETMVDGPGRAVDVADGARIEVVGGSSIAVDADALMTQGGSSRIVVADAMIRARVENASPIQLQFGTDHRVEITNSMLSTTTSGGDGVDLSWSDTSNELVVTNSTITTEGDSADPINMGGGTAHRVTLIDTDLTASGEKSEPLGIAGSEHQVDVTGGVFTATGSAGDAVDIMGNGHHVTLTGTALRAEGPSGDGIAGGSSGGVLTVMGGTIEAFGSLGTGIALSTLDMEVILGGALVVTSAQEAAVGAWLSDGSLSLQDSASMVSENESAVILYGDGADLRMTDQVSIRTSASAGNSAAVSGVELWNVGGTAELLGGSVEATGQGGWAVWVRRDVQVTLSDVALSGAAGDLLLTRGETTILGSDFAVDGTPVDAGEVAASSGTVSGTYPGGTPFSLDFSRTDGRLFLASDTSSGAPGGARSTVRQ